MLLFGTDHLANTVSIVIVQQYLDRCIETSVCLSSYYIATAVLLIIKTVGSKPLDSMNHEPWSSGSSDNWALSLSITWTMGFKPLYHINFGPWILSITWTISLRIVRSPWSVALIHSVTYTVGLQLPDHLNRGTETTQSHDTFSYPERGP
jgi:hypothetical protein